MTFGVIYDLLSPEILHTYRRPIQSHALHVMTCQADDVRLQLLVLELQQCLVPQKATQDLVETTRWGPGGESDPTFRYHVTNKAV